MIEVLGLTLLRPLWLLALPATLALALFAARRERRSEWASLIDQQLAPHLRALGFMRAAGRDRRIPCLAAAAGIASVALAGPATTSPTAPALRSLDTLVIAVDLSKSMTEGGALETVQAATVRLLQTAGRPVALVLYAGDAYLASAPSDDPHLLETVVAAFGADTMPDTGSRPDRALTLAADILAGAAGRRRDVVLVSDGGGVGPEALHEAEALARSGAVVSVIYVPPTERPYGMPAPDPDALAALARAGGGTMVAAPSAQGLADRLAASATATVPHEIAALMFEDHGRAILVLALLPALLLFRRVR
ncbi:hypothetical protein DLJ53_07390 [Acuticoccus sediminis]|uniref:VWFA domain-containing protein n=1 Tax=Acuticoccus sediminis TaxID=2184697 RepID=A0A8B2NVS0_9HYPH|nr:vWA domain-containing protein [Acuticoccus sediminis]RAI04258.1 hypothetical protein DLJ53_07390 [Acuticoccus sediminis]